MFSVFCPGYDDKMTHMIFSFNCKSLGDSRFDILFQILHSEGKFSPKYCHAWCIVQAYSAFCHQAEVGIPAWTHAKSQSSLLCVFLGIFYKAVLCFHHHLSMSNVLTKFLALFYNHCAFILSSLTLPSSLLFHAPFLCLIAAGWNLLHIPSSSAFLQSNTIAALCYSITPL